MVVFFPSYKLLDIYQKEWGAEKIGKKLLFTEPKLAIECEKVLKSYEEECTNENKFGAVLLSVVGGKLAEGINFNDDLGRAVFIIGQPYPDIKSPILQEKLTFLKENNDTSNYPDTLCWRAINQSIGRAIRHKNDYATIILMDQRYCQGGIGGQGGTKNLPDWIKSNVVVEEKFGGSFGRVKEFFKNIG